jgi:hypothetical protein
VETITLLTASTTCSRDPSETSPSSSISTAQMKITPLDSQPGANTRVHSVYAEETGLQKRTVPGLLSMPYFKEPRITYEREMKSS